ncbi:hypothetical protein NQ315_017403, partial [Exocentrus adspersus]
ASVPAAPETFNYSHLFQESECESSVGSPEPASLEMGADTGTDLTIGSKHGRLEEANSNDPKMSPNSSAAASHLNGTMAGLVTLQNLQNLASLQQSLPQVASLAAGLSNMANLTGNSAVNAPLNLSVSASGLATQTILTIPVNHVNSSDQMVNLALNNGQVMQTSLANLQAMAQSNLLNNHTNPVPPTSNGTINPNLLNPATITHLLSNGSAQQLLQTIPQMLNNPHTNPNPSPLLNPLTQPLLSPAPSLLPTPTSQPTPQHRNQMNTSGHYSESKLHTQSLPRNPSPPNVPGNPNRMANNGEISISTSHGLNSSQSMKRSPSSLSPNCTDSSTADLLIDSPNQPTINQTNSNVVDGINLDEIKDFAKAFKLRRLSLGLTQTQVGQALSVTEGPAYSQSAICSALASQMFAAAQLSTQQQAMFEKLDITPKSAQKIKPVLERWMKEAEDRYKSGQNHLTDFIGIEPSKKRKRRTSFTPQALELLNAHFERNTHPSGTEITGLAHQLGYEREVIRIWFCNKRQALKNTVRMMSKGMV